MSDTSIDPRQQLSQLLEGRTDLEILENLGQLDVDETLGAIFEEMTKRFHPERAAGQDGVVQWEILTPQGTKTFQVTIEHGTCTSEVGASKTPRVTLTLAIADFLRFIAGTLDGMQAFMTGKLRLAGDLMFAQSMQQWFD